MAASLTEFRGGVAVRQQPVQSLSMMPKSVKRFSDDIMLKTIEIDHVHDFGLIQSEVIVI